MRRRSCTLIPISSAWVRDPESAPDRRAPGGGRGGGGRVRAVRAAARGRQRHPDAPRPAEVLRALERAHRVRFLNPRPCMGTCRCVWRPWPLGARRVCVPDSLPASPCSCRCRRCLFICQRARPRRPSAEPGLVIVSWLQVTRGAAPARKSPGWADPCGTDGWPDLAAA